MVCDFTQALCSGQDIAADAEAAALIRVLGLLAQVEPPPVRSQRHLLLHQNRVSRVASRRPRSPHLKTNKPRTVFWKYQQPCVSAPAAAPLCTILYPPLLLLGPRQARRNDLRRR